MKLTLKLTEEVRDLAPFSYPEKAHTETLVDLDEVTFSRGLMGSFLRALADEVDPHVREVQS